MLILAEILLANTFVLQVVKTTSRYEGQRKNALVCWWSLQRKLHCCWKSISGNLWPIRNGVVRYENRSWHLWVVKVFLLCSLQIPFKHLIEYLQNAYSYHCWVYTGFKLSFGETGLLDTFTRTLTKICYCSVFIVCTTWNMYFSFET